MRKIAQTHGFKNLIDSDCIYIDKTEQIFNLLKTNSVFISRPRRFGKSLMLDTIGTLFEYGVDPYFKGTWIYGKWTDQTYPVLRLDFLRFSVIDYDEFASRFKDEIGYFAKRLGLGNYLPKETPGACLISLFRALDEIKKKIVILIDEYDAQLTANIGNHELYEKFRSTVRDLYGILKSYTCIRFLCITGVTRLRDVSVFSVGYDMFDLSYASEVAEITGFTREEIRKYYSDYIDLAVTLSKGISEEQVTEEQRDELLDRLAEEYNGYCFDETNRVKVFSTWSVNSFFLNAYKKRYVVFGDYWYDNGGIPSILANYLKTHDIQVSDMLFEQKTVACKIDDFLNPTSLLTINQKVLMCQTGYLTLASRISGLKVILRIPNREVTRALARLVSLKVFDGYDESSDITDDVFINGDAEQIVSALNFIFNTISYEKYPISDEKAFQGYMHIFLLGAGQPVLSEVQSAAGRADIVLEYEHRRLVFELKYGQTEAECDKKLLEAVEQIKTRRYGEVFPKKQCLKLALVFNGDPKTRKITHYAEVR